MARVRQMAAGVQPRNQTTTAALDRMAAPVRHLKRAVQTQTDTSRNWVKTPVPQQKHIESFRVFLA
jgi:hypothetical protein